jgi:hypothetical protein
MEDRLIRLDDPAAFLEQPLGVRAPIRRDFVVLIGFFGFHVLLAGLFQLGPEVATAHALLICAVTAWAVLRWNSVGIACLAAYVGGADVLWRMTGAEVPWEISKYLIAVLCLGGVLRLGRRAHWNGPTLIYFLALFPSIAVLLQGYDGGFRELAQLLSFNLSGPLCLFASAWYMSQIQLERRDVRLLLASFIGPALTIALLTLIATSTATELTFTDESSFATSGGFGPNQVSVVLGLGALCSLLVAIDPKCNGGRRWAALSLFLFFATQSVMTFSRGGLYSFGIAFGLAALVFWRDRSSRRWLIRISIGVTLIGVTLVFPRLDAFTGGGLKARFEDTSPTGRDDIMQEDLRLWRENPVFGLGPGAARLERRGNSTISHTEYTRMLSEHGLFGAFALLTLAALCTTQLLRHQPHQERALRIAFMAWSLVTMLHVGMRVAAIGLVFGWGCARTLLDRHAASEHRTCKSGHPDNRDYPAA